MDKSLVATFFIGLSAVSLLIGLIINRRSSMQKQSTLFLVTFALFLPLLTAALGIGISYLLNLKEDYAIYFTYVCAGASFIIIPIVKIKIVPKANVGLLLSIAMGIVFLLNVAFGIPLYLNIIHTLWK